MKLTIQINLGNAAFEGESGPEEVARILKHAAEYVRSTGLCRGDEKRLLDVNGNHVGTLKLSPDTKGCE